MVTGDNPLTAKYIAEKAGVDDFIVRPNRKNKLEYIRREAGGVSAVAMMGDWYKTDAPALAQADVAVEIR